MNSILSDIIQQGKGCLGGSAIYVSHKFHTEYTPVVGGVEEQYYIFITYDCGGVKQMLAKRIEKIIED